MKLWRRTRLGVELKNCSQDPLLKKKCEIRNVVVSFFVRTERVSYSISIRQWRYYYYCSDLVKCRCGLVRCGRTGLLSVCPLTLNTLLVVVAVHPLRSTDVRFHRSVTLSISLLDIMSLDIFIPVYHMNTGFCSTYLSAVDLYSRISSDLSIRLQRINPVEHCNPTVGLFIQEHLLSHFHYHGYYRNVLDINKFNDQFLDTFDV